MKKLLLPVLLFFALFSFAQNVMLQGWYLNYPARIGIERWGPSFDGYIPDLAEAGFNYIWLPPLSRPNSYPSDGYDIKDYYDLGGLGLGPTSFGTTQDV